MEKSPVGSLCLMFLRLSFIIQKQPGTASTNSVGLAGTSSTFFSHSFHSLFGFLHARCAWRENGSRKEKRVGEEGRWGGEQSGAHWSLNILVLNMKIYYSIMCSVCKLEGNHMKRSQTKSLLCSNWPPPTLTLRLLQLGGREREGRGKRGRCVCRVVGTEKGQYTHWLPHTARPTGAQVSSMTQTNTHQNRNWNFICRCETVIVTCSLLYLSWRGKTLSLFGERVQGGSAVKWSRRGGKLWKSLFE